jgi:tight adherence protein B
MSSVAMAHQLGAPVPDALRVLAGRPGAGDLTLVAAAWQVTQRSGGGLADSLAEVAGTLRERRATRRLVRSELSSARSTARLIAALPVLTLFLGSGTGGDPIGFLLTSPVGLACLGAGVLLTLLGLWWIEAIAGSVEAAA